MLLIKIAFLNYCILYEKITKTYGFKLHCGIIIPSIMCHGVSMRRALRSQKMTRVQREEPAQAHTAPNTCNSAKAA